VIRERAELEQQLGALTSSAAMTDFVYGGYQLWLNRNVCLRRHFKKWLSWSCNLQFWDKRS